MKKAIALTAGIAVLLTAQLPVYGDAAAQDSAEESVNRLNEYYRIDWVGDPLYYDESSAAMFFQHAEGKSRQTASYTITFENGSPAGLWFYTDIGNGSNGGDNGTVEINITDADGDSLFSINSETVTGEDNFRRHYLGKEDGFFPVSEKAAAITVTLTANDVDGGQLVDVYFRNLSLVFGTSGQTDYTHQDLLHLYSSDKLTKVEIGNRQYAHWLWIGIIFAVAMVFYFIRMRKNKYRTTQIIKPKKTYEK